MGLILSLHSQVRSNQRSIPYDLMEFLYKYGEEIPKPGGATAYVINNDNASSMIRDLKLMIKRIEKAKKKMIIVNDRLEQVITAYQREM
jgi:hypothetical protein